MESGDRFRINSPSVAWENFEDETILVNLETGEYFSTRESGAEIWRRLAEGASLSEVCAALLALYDVEQARVESALHAYVETLRDRDLIVPADASAPTGRTETIAPNAAPKLVFVEPAIEVYSDMQDLLLLDPIHEVDESGWPNAKE